MTIEGGRFHQGKAKKTLMVSSAFSSFFKISSYTLAYSMFLQNEKFRMGADLTHLSFGVYEPSLRRW